MKPVLLTTVAILTALFFQDCCKVYCPREMMNIAFVGFAPDELDTIMIRKFEPGGFTQQLDSTSIIHGGFSRDTLIVSHMDADGFDRKKNYEIFLPATSASFRVTDIKTKRYDCICGQRDGRGVAGYTLNGSPVDSDVVFLNK